MTAPEAGWARLARALDEQRRHLGMTRDQVTAAGGPSDAWQRRLRWRDGESPTVRERRILPRLDRAVRWPEGKAFAILTGGDVPVDERPEIVAARAKAEAYREAAAEFSSRTQEAAGQVREHWRGRDYVDGQDAAYESAAEWLRGRADKIQGGDRG